MSWKELIRELAAVKWETVTTGSGIEEQYSNFLAKCQQVSVNHVPLKKSVVNKSIPPDRKLLMRKRTTLRKKLKQTVNAPVKQRIEEKIRGLEGKLKASVDKEMSLQEAHAVSCIKSNPQYFYKYAAGL